MPVSDWTKPRFYSNGRKPPEINRVTLIQGMLSEGLPPKEIADELGITKTVVYNTIRRYGLKIKKNSPKGD